MSSILNNNFNDEFVLEHCKEDLEELMVSRNLDLALFEKYVDWINEKRENIIR